MDTFQKLTLLRSRAFGMASSGKYGSYSYDDTFNDVVEEGFSDDGSSWTALDGTIINFQTLEREEFLLGVMKKIKSLNLKKILIEEGIQVKSQQFENIRIKSVERNYITLYFYVQTENQETTLMSLADFHPNHFDKIRSGIESAIRLLEADKHLLVGCWKLLPEDWEGYETINSKPPQELFQEIQRQRLQTNDRFIDRYTLKEFEETFNSTDQLTSRKYFCRLVPNVLRPYNKQ